MELCVIDRHVRRYRRIEWIGGDLLAVNVRLVESVPGLDASIISLEDRSRIADTVASEYRIQKDELARTLTVRSPRRILRKSGPHRKPKVQAAYPNGRV